MKAKSIADRMAAQRRAREARGARQVGKAARSAKTPAAERIEVATKLLRKREKTLANAKRRLAEAEEGGPLDDVAAARSFLTRTTASVANARLVLMRARMDLARARKSAELTASLLRYADRVQKAGAGRQKQWTEDRRKEAKRIRAIKRNLAERLRDDRPPPPGVPQIDVQPPSEESIPEAVAKLPPLSVEELAAARLQSAQWVVDREVATAKSPDEWTPEYVAERMVEAFETLMRLPMKTRPSAGGAVWPGYRHSVEEWATQAAMERALPTATARTQPGKDEISRMEEALAWPMRFLQDDPLAAKCVSMWAYRTARGAQPALLIKQLGVSRSTAWRARDRGLGIVVRALKEAGAPVE